MTVHAIKIFTVFMTLSLSLSFLGDSNAETLNPEGVNPHADAPRKKITQKQKQAAAEAMKQKKAEIAARKAAQSGQKNSEPVQNSQPAASNNGSDNIAK